MTKQEFIDRLPEGTKTPSDKDYELIEYVYTHYPSMHEVEGKDQIAYLYSTFGIRIIRDMHVTAKQNKNLYERLIIAKAAVGHFEKELNTAKATVSQLEHEIKQLSDIYQ